MIIYILLFFNIFAVYLYTLFPTIAAYRDAGEMATVGYILGIAHSPGYPLYTILTYLFGKIIPFGNFAYRINIFSAIFSSLTSVLFFLLFNFFVSKFYRKNFWFSILGYLISLVFSFGYLQWYLSIVSEMYTLNTFFAVLVVVFCCLYFFLTNKIIYLLFFVFGLGITNRLDLVLFAPILLFVFYDYIKNYDFKKKLKITSLLTVLFLLGASCYFYMSIRSTKNPFIDWNNPQELKRFYSSLLRKTHGSTLDLISAGYNIGENFFDGIKFYSQHILNNITIFGLPILLLGFLKSFKINKYFALSLLFCWILSCVFFIYKANMPPNPHSFAILEAHFLLPNIVLFLWLILGILDLCKKDKIFNYVLISVILFFVLIYNFSINIQKLNKRENFYAYDYTSNIFKTLPNKSIVVVKEDVQVFSLWYRKFVDKIRPEVYIISAGLSGSEWYNQMCYDYYLQNNFPQVYISYVFEPGSLKDFIEKNLSLGYNLYFTYDVEIPSLENYQFIPKGLTRKIRSPFDEEDILSKKLFEDIYIFRGKYKYDLDWEFFSSDIIEDYSKAYRAMGYDLIKIKNFFGISEHFYKTSIYMNPDLPYNYFELGYLYFTNNFFDKAYLYYKVGIEKFEEYLKLAKRYKTSSDVIEDIKNQFANCYLHLGVVCEKLGKIDEAIKYYNKSIEKNPYLAEAYYNLAVVYWHLKDWQKVIYYFKETLKINPNHKEAKFYLEKLLKSIIIE
jgi:hypothetical protein